MTISRKITGNFLRILNRCFLSIFLIFNITTATIIHIPQDQRTIQAGIDIAVHEDTILVAEGMYKENINFNGKRIVIGSLFLITGDTTSISKTVIDGTKNGSVSTFENGEDSTSVLIGITLTNGLKEKGGGIYCYESSPLLKNLILEENIANRGGGIYCERSSPLIEHLIIRGNLSGGENPFGGGLYCTDSSSPSLVDVTIINNSGGPGGGMFLTKSSNPDLVDVIISNNSGGMWGGGIYCESSNPRFKNVVVSENRGGFWGGGIYLLNSSPSLEDVTISRNVAGRGAGITCSSYSSPTLINVKVTGNIASEHGGGIECMKSSNPKLVNVTLSDNISNTNGGGIHCINKSTPHMVNVTLSRNTARGNGSGIYLSNSSVVLVNSILWDNQPHEIYFAENSQSDSANSATIVHSDIQEGEAAIITNDRGEVHWLAGNIKKKPQFVNSENGDFQLLENSPCIDTGINFHTWNGDTLVNIPGYAYQGNAPDMGAFESPYTVTIDEDEILVTEFVLDQNYPNPFNPTTTLRYNLPQRSEVLLTVYDILGREIRKLVNMSQNAGYQSVIWDGTDEFGKSVGTGIYLYQIQVEDPDLSAPYGGQAGGIGAGDFTQTRKMLLLR